MFRLLLYVTENVKQSHAVRGGRFQIESQPGQGNLTHTHGDRLRFRPHNFSPFFLVRGFESPSLTTESDHSAPVRPDKNNTYFYQEGGSRSTRLSARRSSVEPERGQQAERWPDSRRSRDGRVRPSTTQSSGVLRRGRGSQPWPSWPSCHAKVGRPGRERGTTRTRTEPPPTGAVSRKRSSPHSGGLPNVQQEVADHLGHDRLPFVERVLWDHHRHTAATNSVLHKLVAIVNRWLEVTGCTQKLPKTAGKPVPVQASGVHVSLRVNDQQLFHLSQQKTDGSADGNKNY